MPRLALKDLGQCSPVELASQHHLQPIKGDIEQLLQHDKLAKPSRFTAEALTIFLPKSSLLDFFSLDRTCCPYFIKRKRSFEAYESAQEWWRGASAAV
jgi:hypothetical protein